MIFQKDGGVIGGAGEVVEIIGIDGSAVGVFTDAVEVMAVGEAVGVDENADVSARATTALVAGTDDVEECGGGELIGFETGMGRGDLLSGGAERGVEALVVVGIEISEDFARPRGGVGPMAQGRSGVRAGTGDVVVGGDAIDQLGEIPTELAN